ncbi:hypothetical protein B296_00011155 [Ensete ventricosum]|uniref:AP complex mu/sigma subunit domain-containing protein n=1 Tax=Ensete ventricosum TaxID=4639 RepID=A0A426YZL8_ENSVE|nr:hypothetical protein B296_00011155 [Ensete ventricosum]
MAGAVSALFLLDIKGRVLIWRDYRGDVSAVQAERFFTKLIEKEYELLDEMMDFGYPQYTEAKILSEFIKTDAYRMEVTQRPPMAVTNAVSWRSEGIRYKKNEVGHPYMFKGVLGCGRKCQYSCQQQWTDYPFRCCWGIENENILEVKPPIWVEAQVERHSRSRIEMMVKARSQFKERRC